MSLLEHDFKRGAQTMDQYLHKQALSAAAKIAEESRWEYIAMILLEKSRV